MQRQTIDLAAYARRSREGPCFICGIVNGSGDPPYCIVYPDAS